MNLRVTGSLLGALDALAVAATALLVLFITIILSAASSLGVSLGLRELAKHEGLSVHLVVSSGCWAWQRCFESSNFRDGDGVREGNLEHDEEVTKLEGSLVERKTLISDSLQIIGLDDLARLVLNSNLATIKVS